MIKMKTMFATLFAALVMMPAFAQETTGQPASFMESNGKIYVVLAVVVTIVAGLLIYVVRLDRKISKMEKRN
ncbi:MAG TPA: CcmD family protein [Chitinophagaceae bacterium]